MDVYRGRLDYPVLKRAVRDRNSVRPGLNLIEDKSSGTPLIQELSREGLSIKPYRSNLDKVLRMHSTSGMIENGLVFLPEKAEWRNEFMHELTIFPKGRYDDQVDSVSQCLDWIRQYQNRRRWYVHDAFTGKLIAEY